MDVENQKIQDEIKLLNHNKSFILELFYTNKSIFIFAFVFLFFIFLLLLFIFL